MKDGGPAFPRPASRAYEHQDPAFEQDGMTLRDYFAAAALEVTYRARSRDDWHFGSVAEDAYLLAEAMLREREKYGRS